MIEATLGDKICTSEPLVSPLAYKLFLLYRSNLITCFRPVNSSPADTCLEVSGGNTERQSCFLEIQSHLFEAMYRVDCRSTGRSQIFWLIVRYLKNMTDILHFICLPLPPIKRQMSFFMLLLGLCSHLSSIWFWMYQLLQILGFLIDFYVLYKLWLYSSYWKLWKYDSLAQTLPLGTA